ncbi:unnamed protein product [Urochloa humidicola]
MANRAPPFLVDDGSLLSIARRRGVDQQELEARTEGILAHIHRAIPGPPVSADAHLCILFDADGGGVDRVSRLPDALLRGIVSRLPIKDAARTAALSRRWRPIWLSAPLVLSDTHLLPAGRDEIPSHPPSRPPPPPPSPASSPRTRARSSASASPAAT